MNASITSKNELKKTGGVTLSVSSNELAVSISGNVVTIQASENEVKCSSLLSGPGPVQDISRSLTLEFSPAELKQLFDAVISAGLLRVSLMPCA